MTEPKRRTPRCKACQEWVDKSLNQHTQKSTGYYHNECLIVIEREAQHYKDLIEYVVNLYRIKAPTGWMTKQIKEYKEQKHYTYVGMEYTLRYMYEVERVELLEAKDSGLGLIPFYYEKARYYYANMAEIKASMREIKVDNTPEIIYLDRPQVKRRNKKINIQDI